MKSSYRLDTPYDKPLQVIAHRIHNGLQKQREKLSLRDRFWKKRSSEVKGTDSRCQQIYIKFVYYLYLLSIQEPLKCWKASEKGI